MTAKLRIRGYRGFTYGYWRYRAECPCGWSRDVLGFYYGDLCSVVAEHRKGCRTMTARPHERH